ncbi:MAG TPA: DUF4129 domain-containing protein [Candidatus Aquilonibacter sp.]|nr:DUF4129 domain-containing protein [Candidatus Aquilonibacter sp.]
MGLSAYESELQRYSTLIEQSKNNPAEIARIRESLPSEWVVNDNGSVFYVPTDSIDSALEDLQGHRNNAGELARSLEFRLAEMRQAAFAMDSRPGGVQLADARGKLNEIFKRREFGGAKGPTPWQLFVNRIEERIARFLFGLLARLHLSARTGNALAWTVIALALIAFCVWLHRTRSRRQGFDELPASSADVSDSRAWLSEAAAAAERADYREAVHCAYWAAIARLEDLKLLKRDRSRTPRESLRVLSAGANEKISLREMTNHFELIWYGYRPASKSDWLEARNLLEKLGCLGVSTAPIASS